MAPTDLPTYEGGGMWARLIAGKAFGAEAKVKTHSPMFYVHWALEAGATAQLPAEYPERAAYVAQGIVEIDGRRSTQARWRSSRPARPCRSPRVTPRHRHAAGRRAGGRALHRMELRVLVQGAHRAGQGRLARRPHEAARRRPRGVHPAARRPAAAAEPMS